MACREDNNESRTIEWLRFVLAVLVVCLHCSKAPGLTITSGASGALRIAVVILGQIPVPIFFVISGYFFFSGLQQWSWSLWKTKITKRCRTILLPYVLWCIIALIMKFIWGHMHDSSLNFADYWNSIGGIRTFYDACIPERTANLFGYDVGEGMPVNAPLWYIRDLFIISLLSPALYQLIKRLKEPGLVILALLYVFNVGFPFAGCSIKGIFFFCLGGYFMINGRQLADSFLKVKTPAYLISGLLFVALMPIYDSELYFVLRPIFVIAGVAATFNLAYRLVSAGKVKCRPILSNSSFFIYASHTVVILDLSNFILWRLLPFENEFVLTLKVFLRPALAVGICLGLFFLMRRFMPKTLSMLTGNRK